MMIVTGKKRKKKNKKKIVQKKQKKISNQEKMSPEYMIALLLLYIVGIWTLVYARWSSWLSIQDAFWISLRYSLTLCAITLLCLGRPWLALLFLAFLICVFRQAMTDEGRDVE
jgi:hypothetical protein